jgi:4-hydroxy-tetrahydrodipicolinate reductase
VAEASGAIPVVVCGRSGHMADLVAGAIREATDLVLASRLSPRPALAGALEPVLATIRDVPCAAPVVVDFTARELTAAVLREAPSVPCSVVIGTSGLDEDDERLLRRAAGTRAIVRAANFSSGLGLVARFAGELAGRLGEGWAAGVVDVHFAGKRDRPSATAKLLAASWAGGRPEAEPEPVMASFRLGDGVSEHRLLAAGPGEQIEVVHRVQHRGAFVPAVLRAVRFARHAGPGLYSLEDVP